MSENVPGLEHQFAEPRQQAEAAELGMWVFLATEVLFFGACLMVYAVDRGRFPETFAACSKHMDLILGSVNTAVLLTSSLTMAFSVDAAERGREKTAALLLWATMALGAAFLVIKGVEYRHKWMEHLIPGPHFSAEFQSQPEAQLFFTLYFVLTGLHALHLLIGIGIVAVAAFFAASGRLSRPRPNLAKITGLYWHFVDIVWIFLFPLLYLIGGGK